MLLWETNGKLFQVVKIEASMSSVKSYLEQNKDTSMVGIFNNSIVIAKNEVSPHQIEDECDEDEDCANHCCICGRSSKKPCKCIVPALVTYAYYDEYCKVCKKPRKTKSICQKCIKENQ